MDEEFSEIEAARGRAVDDRRRLRRRWTALALGAVAVAAAVSLPLALLSPGQGSGHPGRPSARGQIPLTDLAATPAGWAPVAFGAGQISVPAHWFVETDGGDVCGGGLTGMVFVGAPPNQRNLGCHIPSSMASIVPATATSAPLARPAGLVNGIEVLRVRSPRGSQSYLVPALHVRVTAHGPLASRVLGTLTRSPLALVLAPRPRFPVPAGWRWHDFGGIRFAAPAGWRRETDTSWGCPGILRPLTVRLSTATTFDASSYGCDNAFPPDAGREVARSGVVVGAGPAAIDHAAQGEHVSCTRRSGLRICVLQPGPDGAVLTLLVRRSGNASRVLVEIGLGGSGVIARTIFDSIKPG